MSAKREDLLLLWQLEVIQAQKHCAVRYSFFTECVIDVWNNLPSTIKFATLTTLANYELIEKQSENWSSVVGLLPFCRTSTNSYSAKWRRGLCGPPMLRVSLCRGHALRQPSERSAWRLRTSGTHYRMTFVTLVHCQASRSEPNWKHTFLLLRTRGDDIPTPRLSCVDF